MEQKNESDLTSICQVCLYYKGEKEPPYNNSTPEGQYPIMFWYYEQAWVQDQLDRERQGFPLSNFLTEYLAAGLTDFESLDGTPIGLKAVLFNRFMHWGCGSPGDFKRFYLTKYRGMPEAEYLTKQCKYYHCETVSPFAEGSNQELFWDLEKQYIAAASQSSDFHEGWLIRLLQYQESHKSVTNALTAGDMSQDQRAILLYIDAMLEKLDPRKSPQIIDY